MSVSVNAYVFTGVCTGECEYMCTDVFAFLCVCAKMS